MIFESEFKNATGPPPSLRAPPISSLWGELARQQEAGGVLSRGPRAAGATPAAGSFPLPTPAQCRLHSLWAARAST